MESNSLVEQSSAMRCVVLGKNCAALDLSYPLDDQTIFWPGGEGFNLCMTCFKSPEYGYDYAAGVITCAEHGGTHVDAPFHFSANGCKVDEIPLSQLIGSCKVIDVTKFCQEDENYAIKESDIKQFESENGVLEPGDIVLFRTGWCHRYPQGPLDYLGFDEKRQGPYDDNSILRFPGLGQSASECLVSRNVAAVGLDTASLDPGYSKDFIAHQIILGHGIYGIENVNAEIEKLPPTGATIMVLPLKITGGSGSPARVIAFLP